MRTLRYVVLVLTLLASALLYAPASATTTATQAGQLRGVITFDKNGEHPQRSRLTWRVYRRHDGTRTLVERKSWRAGSGLGAKQCANGTWRTDVFIHTEQGDRNRQCPDRKGEQVCRWEYPRIDDYRSWGCIKLSPGDLRELVVAWRRYFDLGADSRVRVHVRR